MKQFRDTPYYVTEDGKVFRYYPVYKHTYTSTHYGANGKVKLREQTKTRPEKWKEIKLQPNGHGYLKCYIGEGKYKTIHRIVAECYVPGYFEGAEVDHIDCNKLNNHPNNLQWCTKEYNIKKGNNPDYPLFSS